MKAKCLMIESFRDVTESDQVIESCRQCAIIVEEELILVGHFEGQRSYASPLACFGQEPQLLPRVGFSPEPCSFDSRGRTTYFPPCDLMTPNVLNKLRSTLASTFKLLS